MTALGQDNGSAAACEDEVSPADSSAPDQTRALDACQGCGEGLDGKGYRQSSSGLWLCESCFIDRWRPHHRKPHWCYLGSIKSDYLKPGQGG